MKKPKYETCAYVEKAGSLAVYVRPGCPRASMVKGYLVSTRKRCRECRSWKSRE